MTAPIRSMDEFLNALRARRDELGLTHETIDAVSGLQSGYTSKLLAPKPIKNLGPMSFSSLLGALGVAVVLVEDQEQIAKVSQRWTKRIRPQKSTASMTASIQCEVPMKLAITPAFKRLLDNPEWVKSFASSGGKSRALKLSPAKRRRIARRAARARWDREKAASGAPILTQTANPPVGIPSFQNEIPTTRIQNTHSTTGALPRRSPRHNESI